VAQYASDTKKYLSETTEPNADHWKKMYGVGALVPVSGIYRCRGCGDEITSNKGDPFPPQNKHQHADPKVDIWWELIVKTQTTGSGR
jgi:hypothetical protein